MTVWNCKERQHFSENNNLHVTNKHAILIAKKLAKHFKLYDRPINFYGHNDNARISTWRMTLSNNPSVHCVCHEICHALCWKKFKGEDIRHGTKKWIRQLAIVENYCKKKNYWLDTFEKKKQQQHIAYEKKLERQAYKKTKEYELECVKKKIKQWQNKVKRAENRLKKLNRRLARLEKSAIQKKE